MSFITFCCSVLEKNQFLDYKTLPVHMFLWPLTSRFVSISRDVLSIKFSAVNRVTNLVLSFLQ